MLNSIEYKKYAIGLKNIDSYYIRKMTMYPMRMRDEMGQWSHLLDYVQGKKTYFYWFYIRKSQYIECFDPHLKILLIMNFIWSKPKSRNQENDPFYPSPPYRRYWLFSGPNIGGFKENFMRIAGFPSGSVLADVGL